MNSRNLKAEGRIFAARLAELPVGSKVKVAGWVEDVRDVGSILFMTVRDVSGVAQIVVRKDNASLFSSAKEVPRQSSVVVVGTLKVSKSTEVPVEVEVGEFQVLSPAVHPLPFNPTGRVPASIDIRLDARVLDLKNPAVAAIFKIRHTALQAIRQSLIGQGCIEVNTSKIIGQASEGGANLFTVDYFDSEAYLAQSPQLYKEQLTLALDRVFEVAQFYRAEKSHTTRHLNEFTSVDVEAAYCDEEDVMSMCERMVGDVIKTVDESNRKELALLGHTLPQASLPFPRITYEHVIDEVMKAGADAKFGEDLTDTLLRHFGEIHQGFSFITKWPVSLKPFYIEAEGELSHSFDLMLGPLELASGGRRVSRRSELERRIGEAGLDPKRFEAHLRSYDWGMPPHAGWGFGFDRFLMALTGRKNVREVVLYPRDQFRLLP